MEQGSYIAVPKRRLIEFMNMSRKTAVESVLELLSSCDEIYKSEDAEKDESSDEETQDSETTEVIPEGEKLKEE